MTHNPSNPLDQAIEPWLLTAYALKELDTADATRVEQALRSDPALRIELEQIQRTLSSVRSALVKKPPIVKLSKNQTAAVVSQIKQVAAPNASVPNATVKLAERPFYLRKRFAALLATAAAIPLVATWGLSLLENGSPSAYYMNNNVGNVPEVRAQSAKAPLEIMPSPSGTRELSIKDSDESLYAKDRASIVASSDASSAGSGLIGNVDVSFVPEIGLVIIKGSKRDVEQAQKVIDGFKEAIPSQRATGPDALNDSDRFGRIAADAPLVESEVPGKVNLNTISGMSNEGLDVPDYRDPLLAKQAGERQIGNNGKYAVETKVSVPDGGTILLGGVNRMRETDNQPNAKRDETSTLMMTVTPGIIVPEEEVEQLSASSPRTAGSEGGSSGMGSNVWGLSGASGGSGSGGGYGGYGNYGSYGSYSYGNYGGGYGNGYCGGYGNGYGNCGYGGGYNGWC